MPDDAAPDQLALIANMFKNIIDDDFRTNVLKANSAKEIINIIENL